MIKCKFSKISRYTVHSQYYKQSQNCVKEISLKNENLQDVGDFLFFFFFSTRFLAEILSDSLHLKG